LLQLDSLPDAIFSSSDFAGLGAIQELKEQGITIPKDFCIVGFWNETFTKFMELSISIINQFPMEMGKIAANVFLDHINKIDNNERKIVLTPELISRKSSCR
jgi:LacI family transcriptional regulator